MNYYYQNCITNVSYRLFDGGISIKKLIILVLLIATLCVLPNLVLASDYTLVDGDTLTLSPTSPWTVTHADMNTTSVTPDDFIVSANASVTVTGSTSLYISLVCEDRAVLTISDVTIDHQRVFGTPGKIIVSGTDVELILEGSNRLLANDGISTYDMPCIQIPEDTSLEIHGDGELSVYAGGEAAAIGGYNMGKLTISGGTIYAESSPNSWSGAAIGQNYRYTYTSGQINITGGTVTAISHLYSAGIGGGIHNSVSAINISGGIVYAKGGTDASGIGTGVHCTASTSGSITISGDALVYAAAGEAGIFSEFGKAFDIGGSGYSDNCIVMINDSANVFLDHNICDPVITTTHNRGLDMQLVNISDTPNTETLYQSTLQSPTMIWENALGGYYPVSSIAANHNNSNTLYVRLLSAIVLLGILGLLILILMNRKRIKQG